MVVLRGLFGGVLSWIPSVLNVVQLIGWGTFELVVIAQAGVVAVGGPTWAWVLGAGVVTTVLTLRPLGMLRLLRRVVTILVAISVAYLAWWLFTRPAAADLGRGRLLVRVLGGHRRRDRGGRLVDPGGVGLLPALAAGRDRVHRGHRRLRRHARSSASSSGSRRSRWSAANGDEVFAPMLAAPFGLAALLVLTLRETDQSFANVYSTAVSAQNLCPAPIAGCCASSSATLVTVLALGVTIEDYSSFLAVIGSVFVPLLGVGVGDALVRRGRSVPAHGDLTRWAPSRPLMVVAWVVGLVAYQLVNPGGAPGWSDAWNALREALGFTPPSWLSASLLSFVVAVLVAAVLAAIERRASTPAVAATPGSTRTKGHIER